jgi:hypothetical protein
MRNWKEENITRRTTKTPNQDGVYVQGSSGITEESKEFVNNYLGKIGEVWSVSIRWDKENIDYITRIKGFSGQSILVDGFSLGYGGEGCRGLVWLLTKTGVQFKEEDVYAPVEGRGSKEWFRRA